MRVLLASDGLTNELPDEEIAAILSSENDRQAAADALVRAALAHGGNDNITVIVADVEDDGIEDPGDADATRIETELPATAVALPAPIEDVLPPHAAAAVAPASIPRDVRTAPRVRERARRIEHLVTLRAVLFIIVLLGLLGGIAGFTVWFNRASYFVGIKDGYVTIYEGRPGGFLWFKPTIARMTNLQLSSVLDSSRSLLEAGLLEPSYDKAQQVVDDLAKENSILGLPTTTTTPPTTTTIFVTTTTTTVPASKAKPKTSSTTTTGHG
jgi:protein phosphatase